MPGFDRNRHFQEMVTHLKSLPAPDLIHKTLLFKDWDVVSPMPWKPGKLASGLFRGYPERSLKSYTNFLQSLR